MRDLSLLLLTVIALSATAAEKTEHPYPLWDGEESVEAYAKRVGLEPTRTIDLGNGVMMEMVLIPAGTFLMGTPEPEPVDEEGFHAKIRTGQVIFGFGAGVLLVLLVIVLVQSIRKWQRPQYSLAWFLMMAVVAGIGFLGGLHWYFSARAHADARREYQAALARYLSCQKEEKPAHHVTISRPFYMGKYEVTQEQYQQVMGVNPSLIKGRPDLPVEKVTLFDVQTYCRRVQEVAGEKVRLPSEAEWEYACRAGTRTLYHSGDDEASLGKAGLYNDSPSPSDAPSGTVGQKEPNAFGLYDMHGNVLEWCADVWHDNYEGAPTDGSAWTGGTGSAFVVRGGHLISDAKECRSAYRSGTIVCRCCRNPCQGFRLAADQPR